MPKSPRSIDDFDAPDLPRSIYDSEVDETELWFLPGPDDAVTEDEMPLPKADHRPLIDASEWLAAQGDCAVHLAQAAMSVGRLDMMVAQMGQGALERLALRDVEAMTWMTGAPLSVDDIGRDHLHARARTDLNNLHIARWAMRRLMSDHPMDDLRGFLGLHRATPRDDLKHVRQRLMDREFDEAEAEFHAARAQMTGAHCFVQTAYEQYLWRLCDLSPGEDHMECAVWAARRLASDCNALTFVPLGQAARRLQHTGPQQLGPYLMAVAQGAQAAIGDLQRVRMWVEAARLATAKIKGDTPARVIEALVAKPLCSAEMIEQMVGVSRDTAERVLTRLHTMHVVREVTGGTRFRLWTAALANTPVWGAGRF